MRNIHKKLLTIFGLLLIAGFTGLRAQSPVGMTIQPVKGQSYQFTLTFASLTPAINAAMTELSNQGRVLEVLESNHQTGIVKVRVINPSMDAEGLKNYLTGYLDYKKRHPEAPKSER